MTADSALEAGMADAPSSEQPPAGSRAMAFDGLARLLGNLRPAIRSTLLDAALSLDSASSWLAFGIIAPAIVAAMLALCVAADRLGGFTTIVTAAVFYCPFLVGVSAALRALARLERDRRVAVSRREIAEQLDLERDPVDKDTQRRFTPPAGELENTPSAAIVSRVALACDQGRYESVPLILALDLPIIRSGSTAVRKQQLQAVRIGILTTFISLMVGLYQVVPLLSAGGAATKTAAIMTLVREMATAFGGSVAGLLAASLLQLLGNLTERKENALLREMEGAIIKIQAYFYHADKKEPVMRSIDALATSLRTFKTSFDEGRIQIDQACQSMATQISKQDEILLSHVTQLAEGRDALGNLVSSQTNAVAVLEQTLAQASQRIANAVRAWANGEMQGVAATTITESIALGKRALADHADSVTAALVDAGGRTSKALIEQTDLTLTRLQRSRSRDERMVLVILAVLAFIGICQCGLMIWLVAFR